MTDQSVLRELKTEFEAIERIPDGKRRGCEFEWFFIHILKTLGFKAEGSVHRSEPKGQIDSVIYVDRDSYLVEVKWEKGSVAKSDMSSFIEKVRSSGSHTHGIFLSMNGFSSAARSIAQKEFLSTELFLIDGDHVCALLDGDIEPQQWFEALHHIRSSRQQVVISIRDVFDHWQRLTEQIYPKEKYAKKPSIDEVRKANWSKLYSLGEKIFLFLSLGFTAFAPLMAKFHINSQALIWENTRFKIISNGWVSRSFWELVIIAAFFAVVVFWFGFVQKSSAWAAETAASALNRFQKITIQRKKQYRTIMITGWILSLTGFWAILLFPAAHPLFAFVFPTLVTAAIFVWLSADSQT